MIKAILVDDEPKCVSLLRHLLKQYATEIQVVAEASNAADATKLILTEKPDLVFLDINMPGKNGFAVIEETKQVKYEVVFTTAYEKFAIDALRLSALDYLLKPIDPQELHRAIQKYQSKKTDTSGDDKLKILLSNVYGLGPKKIAITTLDSIIFTAFKDINYCEANGGYTIFYLKNGAHITASKTMKEYEDILLEYEFFRIHHSYIVNLSEIAKYIKGDGGSVIMSNGIELPVSKRKKEAFLQRIAS